MEKYKNDRDTRFPPDSVEMEVNVLQNVQAALFWKMEGN